MKKIYTILALFFYSLFAQDEFSLGKEIKNSGIYLGGYFSIEYYDEKNKKTFEIDDIDLITYGEFEKFDFLSELELSDSYKKVSGEESFEETHKKIHIERLYITYYFENDDTLNIGKFNSEIGFWNTIPINVLRPTTSSPHLVTNMFPKFTTGLSYKKNISGKYLQDIIFTFQNSEDIGESYNNFPLKKHYAIGFDFEEDFYRLRAGGGYFRYEKKDNRYLFAAFKKEGEKFDWQGEWALRIDDKKRYLHDFYIQNIWHTYEKFDTVFRVERYKDTVLYFKEWNFTAGGIYRPWPNLVIKGEFERHTHTNNRFSFSLSMMF